MAACTLQLGPRRILVSADGPPAAEYALFDSSDVELTQGEGGGLVEAGYRTTASEALHRLAVAGITTDLAETCATIVRGRLAEAYARGPIVRRLAPLLGAAELFEGGTYDATLRRYDGVWLDLPLLANDAAVARGTGVLQAVSLTAMLGEVAGDTPVVLVTLGVSGVARLGERTLRRQAVAGTDEVVRGLRHLAETHTRGEPVVEGPSRETLEAHLKARLETCASAEAREHIARVARALSERQRPASGPLSDPELWDIDRAILRGELRQSLQRIETRERQSGREPATIYLRGRVALSEGREAPRAIALRISELAASMSNFPEAGLLAAQAWDAAGETRAAIPFARDLIANPHVHDEVRAAAEALLRATRTPLEASGLRDFEGAASGGLVRASRPPPPASIPPQPFVRPHASSRPPPAHESGPPPTQRPSPPPVTQRAPDVSPETRRSIDESPSAQSVPPPRAPSFPPPPAAPPARDARIDTEPPPGRRTLTPPEVRRSEPPPRDPRRYLTPSERIASPLPPRSGARASAPPPPPRLPASEPLRPASERPKPASDAPGSMRTGRQVKASPWPTSLRAPREANVRPEEIEHTPAPPRSVAPKFMRGASMPPHASEPPPGIPRAPIVPRVDIDEPELIETLPMPRGASEVPQDLNVVPRTPLEARARFTFDARELARRYRHEDGMDLRLELRTITVMQRRLAERFRSRVVSTPEEAREAELHGALLSEMLARLADAEWVDIAPTELGYWAMALPTRDGAGKRVWPFGRVLRFIASGGEDDLVAFFRKLRELG